MIEDIQGLHHVTAMASDARANNAFYTRRLGLRRVKKTVNFDAPDVYHLYYGDGVGTPGSVMTYFPFPDIAQGRPGTGEVAETVFAVPAGALDFWAERLDGAARSEALGEARLTFQGPDGDALALVERDDDRDHWDGAEIPEDAAIRGFAGARLRLADGGPMDELLRFMGYQTDAQSDGVTRYRMPDGNGADILDVEVRADAEPARQGAGSVHHIAFSVPDRAAQKRVRTALVDAGHDVTPVIDRDYFWAIYFRTPGGVLFEVATDEPGFTRDEDRDHLGEALKLPEQHAHRRDRLERELAPIE